MPRLQRTQQARRDLRAIAVHIARDNPSAATNWLYDIERRFELLMTQPLIGQRLETRRLGIVRRDYFGDYIIYYRPYKDGVRIVRVIHGARDQERQV